MPFTRLLFSALEGDCSYTENGVTASLTNIPGTALLFKLDKHASESREALDLQPEDELCDVLFYVVGQGSQGLGRVLCFVECKRGDGGGKGVSQLVTTAQALFDQLPSHLRDQARFIGAIRSDHGSSPRKKTKTAPGCKGPLTNIEFYRDNHQLQQAILSRL